MFLVPDFSQLTHAEFVFYLFLSKSESIRVSIKFFLVKRKFVAAYVSQNGCKLASVESCDSLQTECHLLVPEVNKPFAAVTILI